MIVDAMSSPPAAPIASTELAQPDSGDFKEVTQLQGVGNNAGHCENIKPSDDGVDLIGDAASWPSLSESTRLSTKLTSAAAISVSESATPTSQGPAPNHAFSPSPSPSPHPNPNPNPNPNQSRHRSSSRGGSARGVSWRSGFIRQTPPPPPHLVSSQHPLPLFYGGFEGYLGGPFYNSGLQERSIMGLGGHPYQINHQISQATYAYSSGHMGRPQGDGLHRYNNVNYRPHQDWNAPHQGFRPRFSQPGLPHYPMAPHPQVPFPFTHAPIVTPDPFMGMPPYTGHAPLPSPSLSSPSVDLATKLLNQINYYFCDENLVKDMYLRSRMDDDGWVPASLIASFRKVQEITQDVNFVLDSMRASSVVEVQGNKMRRRNDWRRWITRP